MSFHSSPHTPQAHEPPPPFSPPASLAKTIEATNVDWNDRIGLQTHWQNIEKGWQVEVDWRESTHGVGLFALEDIVKDTVLRVGVIGVNLYQFKSIQDIETFCQKRSPSSSLLSSFQDEPEYQARILYVKDYLWGFNPHTDNQGYEQHQSDRRTNQQGGEEGEEKEDRFLGMWIPGNGLNHSVKPNTVYRQTDVGISLVALEDIAKNEELLDDYRRHGKAPKWLRDFAQSHQVTLNFAGCNDFVNIETRAD
ncbi:hypothetical protein ACA910_000169 [Epithemia clementina (nom. ined.)]